MNIYRQVKVKIMPPKPEFKCILAVEFPYQKTNVWDDQPTGGLFGHKIVPKFQRQDALLASSANVDQTSSARSCGYNNNAPRMLACLVSQKCVHSYVTHIQKGYSKTQACFSIEKMKQLFDILKQTCMKQSRNTTHVQYQGTAPRT